MTVKYIQCKINAKHWYRTSHCNIVNERFGKSTHLKNVLE